MKKWLFLLLLVAVSGQQATAQGTQEDTWIEHGTQHIYGVLSTPGDGQRRPPRETVCGSRF